MKKRNTNALTLENLYYQNALQLRLQLVEEIKPVQFPTIKPSLQYSEVNTLPIDSTILSKHSTKH
jgi:hypothetical protein